VAVPTTTYPGKIIFFVLLALVFSLGFYRPQPQYGLSTAEAEALWVVRDDIDWEATPRGLLRGVRADANQLLERIREQPQPPLYFAMLDAWTLVAGESVYAVRWLSLLLTLAAVAVMVAALRQLDWFIVALVGFGLSVYPAQTAYTTPLLLLLSALSTWALITWSQTRRPRDGLLYALSLAAVLYTHHIAAPFVALQFVLVLRADSFLRPWIVAVVGAGVLFAPWLLFFQSRQLDPLLTAAGWQQSLIALAVAAIPLLVMLVGQIARLNLHPEATSQRRRLVMIALVVIAAGGGVLLGLRAVTARPDWPRFIQTVNVARDDLDATVYALPPRHALWHYDRLPDTRWRYGVMVDVGWRDQTPEMLDDVFDRLGDQPIWLLTSTDYGILDTDNPLITADDLHLTPYTP